MAGRHVPCVGTVLHDDTPRAGVERLNDDLRRLVAAVGEREKDGASARQQLRILRDLSRLQFHELFRLSAVPRHTPDPRDASLALAVQNRVVARPTGAPWVLGSAQHDWRAAKDRDFLELAV